MDITSFNVYPTSDIHLLLTHGVDMQVEVNFHDRPTDNIINLTTHPLTQYLDFDPAIATVSNGLFKPVSAGFTIGRIRHLDNTNPAKIFDTETQVRVFVHPAIETIWFGNNRATVHEGEDNYVLSVYAKFTDGILGDISSHPYLSFTSADPGFLEVDNAGDKGRIKGIKNSAAIALTVSHNGISDTINGFVLPPVSNVRPILKRIHGAGNYQDRKNILLLGDGFLSTAEHKNLFERICQEITQKLFDPAISSPYDLVKDSFNVWAAFEGSPESGVTVRNPVADDGRPIPYGHTKDGPCSKTSISLEKLISLVGLPDPSAPIVFSDITTKWATVPGLDLSKVSKELFEVWQEQVIESFLQSRDCFFGMGIGARFGDRNSQPKPAIPTPANAWFNNSEAARICTPDTRRLPKNQYSDYFLEKYIKSLRFGTNTADPNYNVYKIWSVDTDWRDWNYVCIIYNDPCNGGTNWGALFFSIGSDTLVPVFKPGGHPLRVDHLSNFISAHLSDGTIDPLALAYTVSHEFAHSMTLSDEYEGYDDPAHTQFTNTAANVEMINGSNNLTHLFELQSSPPKIDGNRIKWNWHRVSLVTKTINWAVDEGSSDVKILVASGEGAKWKAVRDAGLEVFLRAPGMNNKANDRKDGIEGPFKLGIITHSAGSDEIFLKNRTRSVTGKYPKGSILFQPVKDFDNNLVMTIERPVLDFINSSGKGFNESSDCTSCRDGVGFPPDGIPNFSYPAHRYEVIGIYEGGGTFNCKVFRPAGVCQMRTDDFKVPGNPKIRRTTFSFVAKYIIVNHIDPVQLPKLNPLYPL